MERWNFTTKSVDYSNKICSKCLRVCDRNHKEEVNLDSLSQKDKLREMTRSCSACKCEEYLHQIGSYEFIPIYSAQSYALWKKLDAKRESERKRQNDSNDRQKVAEAKETRGSSGNALLERNAGIKEGKGSAGNKDGQGNNLQLDMSNPMMSTFCALLSQQLVKFAANNGLGLAQNK